MPQVEGSRFSFLPVATACPGCSPKFGTCSTSRLGSFILQPLPCRPHSLLHVCKTHFVPNEPNRSCFQRRSVIHVAIPAVTLSVPPACLVQNSLAPAVRLRLPVAPVSKSDKLCLPSAALLSLGYGGCCTRRSLGLPQLPPSSCCFAAVGLATWPCQGSRSHTPGSTAPSAPRLRRGRRSMGILKAQPLFTPVPHWILETDPDAGKD